MSVLVWSAHLSEEEAVIQGSDWKKGRMDSGTHRTFTQKTSRKSGLVYVDTCRAYNVRWWSAHIGNRSTLICYVAYSLDHPSHCWGEVQPPSQSNGHHFCPDWDVSATIQLLWTVVQTFVVPRGRILLTFLTPHVAPPRGCGFDWNSSATIGWIAVRSAVRTYSCVAQDELW